MPPTGALKADVNRAGWESSDFPSVCENCLPDNPYVQMIKENHGLECKICTRPFTVFRWAADRTSRFRKTNVCLTCARLKNCCQCCMLDLTFGLPIVVRDAALKLVTQGPTSSINKEYFAQNNEGKFKDGDIPEEYEKTDAAARDLLKRLANSQPYYRKPRAQVEGGSEDQRRQITAGGESGGQGGQKLGPGPIRTPRGGNAARGGRGGGVGRGGRVGGGGQPGPHDAIPPNDPTITSLFLTGIEDDLPEHAIRDFFAPFGNIRSLVCVHRSRSAFVNYATRQGAEAAAESCQGRAVIQGCRLRVQWGKPRPLGNIDRNQAAAIVKQAAAAREMGMNINIPDGQVQAPSGGEEQVTLADVDNIQVALPPGQADYKFKSQQPIQ
ncbi:hypothetical protein BJ508DRAFT_413896 [Ascobolus immersus RN42]|uniref:RRM domain-containing protein n=1 Tax=Ascobolus immersus RN42 TaxID=1160509 RepID=A0A3N4IDE6_ASCIM|nr:hypothetical protein BJ508DRAFT_413896 [Ascobolus immersus RN42]